MTNLNQAKGLYRREETTVVLTIPASPLLLDEAKARGWRLVYLWHWGNALPRGLSPRGALINEFEGSKVFKDLRKAGCACVRMGTLPHPGDHSLLAVLPDLEAEGRLAAEHFAERGFRHVAFFGRKPWGDRVAIWVGFQGRAKELGMTFHLYRFGRKRGETSQAKAIRKRSEFSAWIKDLPKPIGLLSAGDGLAAAKCIDLVEAGLNVPDDVAVLSRGDDPNICESCMPTISSLQLDDQGRFRAACDWLQRLMDGEKAPEKPIMIPPKGVIVRESSDVLATHDRVVAEAMRYMWDHLNHDFSVRQIAGVVGLSASQLQRRFQKALGRSVVQELLRKRLDEAKHLLRSTSLPIADIAPRLGFHSTTYMHRAFRRSFGMTPDQHRRAQPNEHIARDIVQ